MQLLIRRGELQVLRRGGLPEEQKNPVMSGFLVIYFKKSMRLLIRRGELQVLRRGGLPEEQKDGINILLFFEYNYMQEIYYVYILQSLTTGETYVGQTSDIDRRIAEHNDINYRGTLHTKRRKGPWKLIYFEEYGNRSEAMKREKELKTGKGRDWIKSNFL
jgi:putative endonuclease